MRRRQNGLNMSMSHLLFFLLFFCIVNGAFGQTAIGSLCEVPDVPVSDVRVDCPETSCNEIHHTTVTFVVDGTNEPGRIEISQFAPDGFNMFASLGGEWAISSSHIRRRTSFSFSSRFVERATAEDVGIQALSGVLAREEVIESVFDCVSKPLIQFAFCQTACSIAGTIARAACWGAGAGACAAAAAPSLGSACVISAAFASVCSDTASKAEANCISGCS